MMLKAIKRQSGYQLACCGHLIRRASPLKITAPATRWDNLLLLNRLVQPLSEVNPYRWD
jgi:hypothetical protein